MNSTFVMIKPDAVAAKLVGAILERFEELGLNIERLEIKTLTGDEVDAIYVEHTGKDFYTAHREFMLSGPVVGIVLSGAAAAIRRVRPIVGATDPAAAARGTIRNEYGLDLPRNAVHASDGLLAVDREAAIFFSPTTKESK